MRDFAQSCELPLHVRGTWLVVIRKRSSTSLPTKYVPFAASDMNGLFCHEKGQEHAVHKVSRAKHTQCLVPY